MQVELINRTEWIVPTLWTAIKTCKSNKTPIELWNEAWKYIRLDMFENEQKMRELILRVLKSGHLSIAEHCAFTFAVSGVSRTLLAQYSRHRIGVSLSVQSQRSVKNSGIVWPESIKKTCPDDFGWIVSEMFDAYNRLIECGVPKEDARFILPQATSTNFVTTVNLRSLYDIYQKRVVTPGAQWEIKEMVQKMVDCVIRVEPWLKEFFEEVKV